MVTCTYRWAWCCMARTSSSLNSYWQAYLCQSITSLSARHTRGPSSPATLVNNRMSLSWVQLQCNFISVMFTYRDPPPIWLENMLCALQPECWYIFWSTADWASLQLNHQGGGLLWLFAGDGPFLQVFQAMLSDICVGCMLECAWICPSQFGAFGRPLMTCMDLGNPHPTDSILQSRAAGRNKISDVKSP